MRRGFTLIEMLVVMAIAMILMGIIASGYRSVKKSQELIDGAMTVESTLQKARTQAMQLGKVVRVYFLDGGKHTDTNGKPVNFISSTAGGTLDAGDAQNYLLAFTSYEVPYELRVMTGDGEELSRNLMPEAIGWASLGQGSRGFMSNHWTVDTDTSNDSDWDETTHTNSFTIPKENLQSWGRNCSLIINFSPAGNAWADAAKFRIDTSATPEKYRTSVTNIRVFSLDSIDTGDIKIKDDASPTGFPYTGSSVKNYATIDGTFTKDDGENTTVDSLTKEQIAWFTIKWNKDTGLVELVRGENE